MKRILLTVAFLMCLAGQVWGATYYVKKDGSNTAPYDTPAKGANAIATITALDLNAGDIVEICANTAGTSVTYSERILLTANDAGAAGSFLTIKGRDGDSVWIDGTGNNGAFQISVAGNDYVKLQNLGFAGGTLAGILVGAFQKGLNLAGVTVDQTGHAATPIALLDSAASCEDWTIDSCSLEGVTYGISMGSAGKYHAGVSIVGSTITGGSAAGVYILKGSAITVSDTTISDGTGKGLWLAQCIGPITIDGVNSYNWTGDATKYGFYFQNFGGTSSFTLTNLQSYSNDGSGFLFDNVSEITASGLTSRNNGGTGISFVTGCSNITVSDSTAYSNLSDGFSTLNDSHDIRYIRCVSHSNGDASDSNSGDGFTSHNNDYNIGHENCLAYNNLNSGFAFANASGGTVWNCTAFGNGSAVLNARANLWINSTGVNPTTGKTWEVKNSIFANHYTQSLLFSGVASGFMNGVTQILDYNVHYMAGSSPFASINGIATTWAAYHGVSAWETNSQYSDPLFLAPENNNYQLRWGSPAYNAGTDVGLTSDYTGLPVPQQTTPDIGAYEYHYQLWNVNSKKVRAK